jgi:antitoxin (DNA-binding transcriptional repressor) of toxin-antitoxin stability system
MLQINVKDAKLKLDDLIQAVKSGEEIFIVTDDKQTFQIVSVDSLYPRPQYGSAEGLIEVTDDFDAPLEAFKEYMP